MVVVFHGDDLHCFIETTIYAFMGKWNKPAVML